MRSQHKARAVLALSLIDLTYRYRIGISKLSGVRCIMDIRPPTEIEQSAAAGLTRYRSPAIQAAMFPAGGHCGSHLVRVSPTMSNSLYI